MFFKNSIEQSMHYSRLKKRLELESSWRKDATRYGSAWRRGKKQRSIKKIWRGLRFWRMVIFFLFFGGVYPVWPHLKGCWIVMFDVNLVWCQEPKKSSTKGPKSKWGIFDHFHPQSSSSIVTLEMSVIEGSTERTTLEQFFRKWHISDFL